MKIELKNITMMDIIDAPRLDRIKVVTEDFGPGQGQIIIVCWGRAWSAYWGGMGSTLVQFVTTMDAEYVAENLMRGAQPGLKRDQKREMAYLVRIVKAVQEALRRRQRHELHGVPMTEASPDWEAA